MGPIWGTHVPGLQQMLEAVLKKKQIRKSFEEAGMTDEVTNTVPMFDLMHWLALANDGALYIDKDLGILKAETQHCRSVFQQLMKV